MPRQGKCSCRCPIKVFAKEPGWKRWAPSWEWPNPSLLIEFINQCQLSRTQSFGLIFILPPITLAPSSHLWDLRPTSALTILVGPIKKAGPERVLCRWGHETEATQTTGRKQASPKDQGGTLRRLGQHWWRIALPGPRLRPGNYPDRAY